MENIEKSINKTEKNDFKILNSEASVASTGSGCCNIEFISSNGNPQKITIMRKRSSYTEKDYSYSLHHLKEKLGAENEKKLIEFAEEKFMRAEQIKILKEHKKMF